MSDGFLRARISAVVAWSAVALAGVLPFALAARAPAVSAELTLDAAVDNPGRSPKFVARDKARHPREELAFFGVTPQSTVVEIWPGGGYWTEILAPFLQDHGAYDVALQGKSGSEASEGEPTSSTPCSTPRSMPTRRRPHRPLELRSFLRRAGAGAQSCSEPPRSEIRLSSCDRDRRALGRRVFSVAALAGWRLNNDGALAARISEAEDG